MGCPDGWSLHNSSCYFFSAYQASWYTARDSCRSMDATLLILTNEEEWVRHSYTHLYPFLELLCSLHLVHFPSGSVWTQKIQNWRNSGLWGLHTALCCSSNAFRHCFRRPCPDTLIPALTGLCKQNECWSLLLAWPVRWEDWRVGVGQRESLHHGPEASTIKSL